MQTTSYMRWPVGGLLTRRIKGCLEYTRNSLSCRWNRCIPAIQKSSTVPLPIAARLRINSLLGIPISGESFNCSLNDTKELDVERAIENLFSILGRQYVSGP